MHLFLHLPFVLILALLLNSCQQKEPTNISQQIISKHKIVFNEPPQKIPVPHSVDAPMLGNGYPGVAISGNPEKQVYYIARNDFRRLKSSYSESFPAVLGKIEIDIPGLKLGNYCNGYLIIE